MKKSLLLILTCAASAALLTACTGKKEPEVTSSASPAVESETESFYEELSEIYDDTGDYEMPTAESFKEVSLENPFGDKAALKVPVWDSDTAEVVTDTDGKTRSSLSNYANGIIIEHSLIEDDEDPESILRSEIKKEVTLRMGYTKVMSDSVRADDKRAWGLLSFSGVGNIGTAEAVSIEKVGEGVALKSTAFWYLGEDNTGIDYTPEEKYLTKVRDELGISKSAGSEVKLTDELVPDITLHPYEFSDETVGTKSFMVWEEEPEVVTASDEEEYYSDDDIEMTDSWSESMWETVDGEETFSDIDWEIEEYTESDAEWYDADTESFEEDWYDDEYYEDDSDQFVGYFSTNAQGVFVSGEMYVKSDKTDIAAMMDEYVEELAYNGANELKRSEIAKKGDATWVTVKYGNEGMESYRGLVLIHAVVSDDNTYTSLDIFMPTDASQERIDEYLKAYGLTVDKAEIVGEQESYDFDDLVFMDESGAEAVEEEAVG